MRLSVSILAFASSVRISRDDSVDSSSFVRHVVVDAAGSVGGVADTVEHTGSARAQMLAQMESRVSSLAQAKLTPEAKSVIIDTLLPTVDNEIAASIVKEFETTQQLLADKVAALQSATSAAVAAKSRADQADTDLVTCRETQKSKLSEAEQCEAALETMVADLNRQCGEKRAAAESLLKEKEAAATFDLGSAVCSPGSCDVASDPTCGLGDLAESVKGLQAQVRLKAEHYNALTQQLAAADSAALEACDAAERYPIENTCTTQTNAAFEQSESCSLAHETADLDKCSFGSAVQGKCVDLSGVRDLVAKIKASERSDALSEPDRQQEWQAVQRLKCLLEALRDESDLSQDAAAQCADDEARRYPRVFDYKEEEITQLTSTANFACTETTVSFSGFKCSTGDSSKDFVKSEDKVALSLEVGSLPFSFCGGEEAPAAEPTNLQFFFGSQAPSADGILDTGAGFADHDGLEYGWNCDGNADVDYSSGRRGLGRGAGNGLNHFDRANSCRDSKGKYLPVNWEVAVPNGRYQVTVVFPEHYHTGCEVEGKKACSEKTEGKVCEFNKSVKVKDGKLTVTGYGHDSGKCHSLSVVKIQK
jgi:hypothetical protein